MAELQTWQIATWAVGVPGVSLFLGYVFGGKRKIELDGKAADTSSNAAIVAAASAGFGQAMTSNASILTEYRSLINDMAVVKSDLARVTNQLEEVRKDLARKDGEIKGYKRKCMVLAKIAIRHERDSKDKDTVIDSLALLLSAAKDGKENVEGTILKANQVLIDFTTKYSQNTTPSVEPFINTEDMSGIDIAATLLSEEFDSEEVRKLDSEGENK